MNYKHLSQIERYQIHSLMKAQHNITQIARLLGRDKSTISRELRRNAGCRGYRAKQACELAYKRSESSRNANTHAPWVKEQANVLLKLQWSPEQIASKLPLSHESLYLHVYADKARGGTLWKNLRCQKQKRKRYASGRDRRGQFPNRRPLSERPAHIDKRLQVGHWECDTVIGANHKQAIVTVVERKSGYAVMAKISNKTADLVGAAIIEARGLSSAASAANAAIDHMRDWALGTHGKWVTMGIPSQGWYGIPKDVMFGFPVTCENGEYKVVEGLEIDAFSQGCIDKTLKELTDEQAGVAHLL